MNSYEFYLSADVFQTNDVFYMSKLCANYRVSGIRKNKKLKRYTLRQL